jgi:aspartate aminotransferase-like enzyme
MPGLLPNVDPDGLLEFSVVYTDRSLNHMSGQFQQIVRDISAIFKETYSARSTVLVPGGGTYGMESVARQFAQNSKCMVIRNGWFSYRWTQILEMGAISSDVRVFKAKQLEDTTTGQFAPPPIEEVVDYIKSEKPAVVFVPHVETSSGIILPDDYVRAIGEAVTAANGIFVLDCIASGAMWIDMKQCHVDVLISAPQKGWSSTPCCAMVGLGERARERINDKQSNSFAMDLKKWLQIAETYEGGGHMYHATMPTDSLKTLRGNMQETKALGLAEAKTRQIELGSKVRALLEARNFKSVAAPGFQSPGVVVSYTSDPDIQNAKKFLSAGLQIATGVPLQCDERTDFRTFRLGLFGLEKLRNVNQTVASLGQALNAIGSS